MESGTTAAVPFPALPKRVPCASERKVCATPTGAGCPSRSGFRCECRWTGFPPACCFFTKAERSCASARCVCSKPTARHRAGPRGYPQSGVKPPSVLTAAMLPLGRDRPLVMPNEHLAHPQMEPCGGIKARRSLPTAQIDLTQLPPGRRWRDDLGPAARPCTRNGRRSVTKLPVPRARTKAVPGRSYCRQLSLRDPSHRLPWGFARWHVVCFASGTCALPGAGRKSGRRWRKWRSGLPVPVLGSSWA